MYFYIWVTGVICLVILRILHGISWAVATSSIEKVVIDVFHDLVVEKQWYGMVLGPVLGLWLIKSFSFHYLFLLCTGLALVAFILELGTKITSIQHASKKR
ncbi:major facilitator superfamily MFS_1 domain protein [Bacillus cereus ATCC 10876]|nr:major facilitator superfamily MFS_1 domain protein [Bacillus cereus ATCC 10876]SUU99619.1 major facilitator family transporter [Bacillus cereus]